MRAETLLERMSRARHVEVHGPASEATRLRQSILANLRRVLATRQGHAPAQPDLGTPSPSELIQDHPACIPRLQRTLGSCIQRYEPRLTAVRVRQVPTEGEAVGLRFHISAELADGSRQPLSFTTDVDHSGRVNLAL